MSNRIIYSAVVLAFATVGLAAERISFPLRDPADPSGAKAPSVSANGRYVAFQSAVRLLRSDVHPGSDVYVYDRMTKTTLLVSDDRGGDQPVISANGRFVAYRSLEGGLNRIRVRDLERGGEPLTVSYPIDTSSYNRTAELAAISPEGRYVAYVFRASPNIEPGFPATTGSQIVIADTVNRDARRVDFKPGQNFEAVNQLGRVCLGADGNSVIFDSTDALTADDTNGTSDVYRATLSPETIKRISKSSGVPDLGGATQPVLALDGTTAFFICENPLTTADSDGRTSIYMSSSANGFGAPSFIATAVVPKRLAAQGSISGKFLGFLAQSGRGFIRDIVAGVDSQIVPGANAAVSAPILSGDDRLAVFASTASNLAPGDAEATTDVFAVPVPNAPAERAAPTATVSLSNGANLVAENTGITIGANGTPGSGTGELLTVEVDGVEKFRTTSGSLAPQNYTATRGVHDVRARFFNDAWLEGVSAPASLIVVPASGVLGITGKTSLHRTDAPDGSATFSAAVRIDNRRASVTQALQVVVTITSTPQVMAQFQGDLSLVPNRGESILTVIDVPALASSGTAEVNFSGVTPPTEVIGNGFQGNGWSVIVHLRENGAGGFTEKDANTIFVTHPRLNENTDLPNTGIPVVGPPNGSGFNPGLLQSISIVGPSNLSANARGRFSASAIFSNGNQSCAPVWSLTGANTGSASIDASGTLTARSVSAVTTVTVKAEFSGRTATMPVSIKPTTPIVSVVASDANASEAGDPGQFRILRSSGLNKDLTVNYSLSGKATNGVDFTALNGSVTIPAGAPAATIDVLPLQDANFEGSEDVLITLSADASYRISRKNSARMVISDDEPFPAGQPDLVLRRGKKQNVGLNVVDDDDDEITQTISAKARKGQPSVFTVSLINPNDTPQNYHLLGGSGATGFIVQYLDGDTDVTADVTAGTFAVSQLPGGEARVLTLKITPTADTPIGGSQLCIVQAQSSGGRIDLVSASVQRVK